MKNNIENKTRYNKVRRYVEKNIKDFYLDIEVGGVRFVLEPTKIETKIFDREIPTYIDTTEDGEGVEYYNMPKSYLKKYYTKETYGYIRKPEYKGVNYQEKITLQPILNLVLENIILIL